jgi:hypothetical protein
MDDLNFRKAVLAEPFTKDPQVIEAAKNDSQKKAFWVEIQAMENDIAEVMKIPVPENLAERLILRQSIKQHDTVTKQRPWYLALAASVVFAAVLGVSMMSGGPNKLENDVFAHMDHVEVELMKSAQVDLNAVNGKLASFNGQVNDGIGEIVSANYCYLDKIKSLHVIVRGENGLTSLFVVPDSITESISDTFTNATFKGASFLLESAKIIVVGENADDVEQLERNAKASMSFSA